MLFDKMLLDNLIVQGNDFSHSNFGITQKKSKFKLYSPDDWQTFCCLNGFDVNSEGVYIPQNFTAYVKSCSPFLTPNFFHEFFGHGLFFEHSLLGKKVNDLNNTGINDYFYKPKPKTERFGFCNSRIGDIEGFALWLEDLLCTETGNKEAWELKKGGLPQNYIDLFENFKSLEKDFSRFGFTSQLGFPKYYEKDKLLNVLKKLYKDDFKNFELAILYGSKKPYSDIDLFIVSNNPSRNFFNGWLDVFEINIHDFNSFLPLCDIAVTDPLFSGDALIGGNFLEEYKKIVLKQKISPEAIAYNFEEAERQKLISSDSRFDERNKKIAEGYAKTYLLNAQQLGLGRKSLTRSELLTIL